MTTKSRITPGDGDSRHGTSNGYNNLECRCQPCRDAHAKQHLAYMHEHEEQMEKARKRSRAAAHLARMQRLRAGK